MSPAERARLRDELQTLPLLLLIEVYVRLSWMGFLRKLECRS